MIRKLLFLIITFCTCTGVVAQSLSPTAKISLLTCGPGEELYSLFGHSAIRVCDTAQNTDVVFNYGTFDFNDPNFYLNFVRGKLNYKLSAVNFNLFLFEYETAGRWIIEQEYNFTPEEKQKVYAFLLTNNLPENRYYLYDFLFDNCTTRIRDLCENENLFADQVTFPNTPHEPAPAFREMLHIYLVDAPWSKLGIDMLLGKRTDRVASPREYMFLPDFLRASTANASIHGEDLVVNEQYLSAPEKPITGHTFFTPVFVFALLFIVVVLACFARLPLKWFDCCWWFILGLLGILLVFMWVGTDHWVTKANLNLLWALPTHAVAAFFLLKKQRPKWLLWYFATNAILCVVLLACWKMLPQQLNQSLLIITALSGFRSFLLAKPLLRLAHPKR